MARADQAGATTAAIAAPEALRAAASGCGQKAARQALPQPQQATLVGVRPSPDQDAVYIDIVQNDGRETDGVFGFVKHDLYLFDDPGYPRQLT